MQRKVSTRAAGSAGNETKTHEEIQLVPSQLKDFAEQTEEHTKGGKHSIMDQGDHSFSGTTTIGTSMEVHVKDADETFSLKHEGAETQNAGTQRPKQGTKEGPVIFKTNQSGRREPSEAINEVRNLDPQRPEGTATRKARDGPGLEEWTKKGRRGQDPGGHNMDCQRG